MSDVYNECDYESADEHKAHELQDRDPRLTREQAIKKVKQQREEERGWGAWP
jgi:hypothetical protein